MVLFEPFLSAEPAYCRQWPRSAPHTAQGIVGPAGGTVTAPSAVLVFPPGVVAQDAAITWSQGEAATGGAEAADTEAAGPEAVRLLACFDLAAASTAAPSQPLGFQKPISLTLLYDEAMVGAADEVSLDLRRWNGKSRLLLASTSVSASIDSLQAMLPAPGSYCLFGTIETHSIFLPLCGKLGP